MAATIEILVQELREIEALINDKKAVEADLVRRQQILEIIVRHSGDNQKVLKG